jgi:hypothetical protein
MRACRRSRYRPIRHHLNRQRQCHRETFLQESSASAFVATAATSQERPDFTHRALVGVHGVDRTGTNLANRPESVEDLPVGKLRATFSRRTLPPFQYTTLNMYQRQLGGRLEAGCALIHTIALAKLGNLLIRNTLLASGSGAVGGSCRLTEAHARRRSKGSGEVMGWMRSTQPLASHSMDNGTVQLREVTSAVRVATFITLRSPAAGSTPAMPVELVRVRVVSPQQSTRSINHRLHWCDSRRRNAMHRGGQPG